MKPVIKKAKFPIDSEGKRTKAEEKESTLSKERRRLRRTRQRGGGCHVRETSEENTIWSLQGQNEGPLLSALHIFLLKAPEALI